MLPPSPGRHSRTAASCTDPPVPTSSTPPTTYEGVSDAALTQLLVIVIAVVVSTVLLLVVTVVVVVLVVVMVTMLCRKRGKEGVHEDADANRGVGFQVTENTLQSATYYEPKSLDVDPTHFQHQHHPLHTPPMKTASDNGDHILMQECPAYQPIVDMPTSGDYVYI